MGFLATRALVGFGLLAITASAAAVPPSGMTDLLPGDATAVVLIESADRFDALTREVLRILDSDTPGRMASLSRQLTGSFPVLGDGMLRTDRPMAVSIRFTPSPIPTAIVAVKNPSRVARSFADEGLPLPPVRGEYVALSPYGLESSSDRPAAMPTVPGTVALRVDVEQAYALARPMLDMMTARDPSGTAEASLGSAFRYLEAVRWVDLGIVLADETLDVAFATELTPVGQDHFGPPRKGSLWELARTLPGDYPVVSVSPVDIESLLELNALYLFGNIEAAADASEGEEGEALREIVERYQRLVGMIPTGTTLFALGKHGGMPELLQIIPSTDPDEWVGEIENVFEDVAALWNTSIVSQQRGRTLSIRFAGDPDSDLPEPVRAWLGGTESRVWFGAGDEYVIAAYTGDSELVSKMLDRLDDTRAQPPAALGQALLAAGPDLWGYMRVDLGRVLPAALEVMNTWADDEDRAALRRIRRELDVPPGAGVEYVATLTGTRGSGRYTLDLAAVRAMMRVMDELDESGVD